MDGDPPEGMEILLNDKLVIFDYDQSSKIAGRHGPNRIDDMINLLRIEAYFLHRFKRQPRHRSGLAERRTEEAKGNKKDGNSHLLNIDLLFLDLQERGLPQEKDL